MFLVIQCFITFSRAFTHFCLSIIYLDTINVHLDYKGYNGGFMIKGENMNYIDQKYRSIPVPQLAKQLDLPVLSITAYLRKKGLRTEVHPLEVQYILTEYRKQPLKEIQKTLHLSDTQLSQLLTRLKIGTTRKGYNTYSQEEIIQKTKWLIEEKLWLPLDDSLPKEITNEAFLKNDLYGVLKFGEVEKQKNTTYRYFSTVAYLMELAYPGIFRPYQFAHSHLTKKYFTKAKYAGELLYILQHKMRYELELLPTLVNVNGFLTRTELQYYGLGPRLYMHLFGSKEEMVDYLLKHLRLKVKESYMKTDELRDILMNTEQNPYSCGVPECASEEKVEIHHIFPKKVFKHPRVKIDDVCNLLPLCKPHHYLMKKMDPAIFQNLPPLEWKEAALFFIEKHKSKI